MKSYILIIFVCLLALPNWAQNKETHEQIQSLKIAHISTSLDLTKEEAEKFWPIYNTYSKKMNALRHNSTIKYIKSTDLSDISKLSEKEAKLKLQELMDDEGDYFITRKNFMIEIQKILSSKKIILLKKSEDDFNRKLLKKYKDNK